MDKLGLSQSFIDSVIKRIKFRTTVAIVVFGSYARGKASSTSDVDLTHYVNEASGEDERLQIWFQDGLLVSVVTKDLETGKADLLKPESAVWAVPSLRSAKALYDPTGVFADLQKEAQAFQWEPLQEKADQYASFRLMKFSEEAYKLSSSLAAKNSQSILTETIWLVLGLPMVIAVQKGISLENETRLPLQVQSFLGEDSTWSKCYRQAAGLETPSDGFQSLETRGRSAVELYRETARLLWEVILPKHKEVVQTTLSLINVHPYP